MGMQQSRASRPAANRPGNAPSVIGNQNGEAGAEAEGGAAGVPLNRSCPPKPQQKQHKNGRLQRKRTFIRRHTVNNLNVPGNRDEGHHHENLFRNASHGDFSFHDDLRSVSKRFTNVLRRSESCKSDDRERVAYKRDFQTKYNCDFTSPLSHGRYATVTAAENFITAQNFAVKIIRKDKLVDRKSGKKCAGEDVTMEVLALQNLVNQPNVVKFQEVYEDEVFFYVVMELCRGGNLLERINKDGPMKEEQAGPLLRQMLTVTRICHSRGIAHRDLKLENFVFKSDTEDYPLNLVDFGSAAFFKSGERRPFKGAVGTFNYMAPEVHDSPYGPSADVWSLGIIAYAMLCSSLPFIANSSEELKEKVKTEEIAFSLSTWEQVSEGAKDLLKKMLEKNPDFRITLADALAHPWLRQWDF